eukprot:gene2629-2873_t
MSRSEDQEKVDPGEEAVEEGLTEGLRKVFSDHLLLPLYPLKAIVQALLTQEIYSGLPLESAPP